MSSTLPSVVVVVDDSDDDSENDPDPEVNSEDKTLIVLCEMVSLTSLQIYCGGMYFCNRHVTLRTFRRYVWATRPALRSCNEQPAKNYYHIG